MARSGGVGRSATADGVGGLACWPTRSFASLRSGLFSSRKLSELFRCAYRHFESNTSRDSTAGATEVKPGVQHQRNSGYTILKIVARKGRRNGGD